MIMQLLLTLLLTVALLVKISSVAIQGVLNRMLTGCKKARIKIIIRHFWSKVLILIMDPGSSSITVVVVAE